MFVFRLLKILHKYWTMTSIRAALVRLNVVPPKIGFWEVQIENAIKRAEFLDDFDAEQVSEEKQDTKSELSRFERALRAGTRGHTKWKPHIQHNCKLDDFRAGFEIAKGYWFRHG